jgi:hypothetical protein
MRASRRHGAVEKLVQSQLLDEFQRQPRTAELPAVLHAHARAVDLDEPRLGVGLWEQFWLRRWRPWIGRLLDAQPARFVHQPHLGHGSLSRPALGAVRFDERPIRFASPVAPAEMGSQEHAPMLATIGSEIFHYTPRRAKNLDDPLPQRRRKAIYVKKRSKKNRRPTDFVDTLGKLG